MVSQTKVVECDKLISLECIKSSKKVIVEMFDLVFYLWTIHKETCRFGLGVWFLLRVQEVPGSNPGADLLVHLFKLLWITVSCLKEFGKISLVMITAQLPS